MENAQDRSGSNVDLIELNDKNISSLTVDIDNRSIIGSYSCGLQGERPSLNIKITEETVSLRSISDKPEKITEKYTFEGKTMIIAEDLWEGIKPTLVDQNGRYVEFSVIREGQTWYCIDSVALGI